MPGIGKDQWLRYHFNGENSREDNSTNLSIEFNNSPTKFVLFERACKNVAQEIFELNKEKKIYVAMSGGCDSETVANSFYKEGITFIPIIHELYYGGLETSYADTWWAKRWCKERGIEPYIRRITYKELLGENISFAEKIKARKLYSLQNVSLAEHAKDNDGILVNGQAFIEYYPEPTLEYLKDILKDPAFDNNKSGWLLHEDDFYIDMNDPGYHPYNFLSWNSEIVLSYIQSRDMKLNSEDNKFKIMKCNPRPKLAAPDIAWTFLADPQRELKQKYGTSEVCFLGTHDEVINKLENKQPIYKKRYERYI